MFEADIDTPAEENDPKRNLAFNILPNENVEATEAPTSSLCISMDNVQSAPMRTTKKHDKD